MSGCNHNCSSCSSKDCKDRKGIQKAQLNPYSKVKKVIGVISGKGGVGKSLVTSLLSVAMNKDGYRVGILDGDISTKQPERKFEPEDQMGFLDIAANEILEELRMIDATTFTPIEAMNMLFELQRKARG